MLVNCCVVAVVAADTDPVRRLINAYCVLWGSGSVDRSKDVGCRGRPSRPVHASFVVGGDSLSLSLLPSTLALLVSKLITTAALSHSLSLELWRR